MSQWFFFLPAVDYQLIQKKKQSRGLVLFRSFVVHQVFNFFLALFLPKQMTKDSKTTEHIYRMVLTPVSGVKQQNNSGKRSNFCTTSIIARNPRYRPGYLARSFKYWWGNPASVLCCKILDKLGCFYWTGIFPLL